MFKSNKAIYAQLIDDRKRMTLAAASSVKLKEKSMLEKAKMTGGLIAAAAKSKGISKVVFDRGGYVYTGNVRAFADAARKGGLEF
jgi:large subunit ribosomal protein L18